MTLPTDLAVLEGKKTDWGDYLSVIPKEQPNHRKRRINPAPSTLPPNHPAIQLRNGILDRQIGQMKLIAARRRTEMNAALGQYRNWRQRQLDADIRNKAAELDTRYNQAMAEKLNSQQRLLQKYQLELEESQKNRLVNLRLKLAVLEVSHQKDSGDAEQDLHDQIEKINRENEARLNRRKAELQKEYHELQIAGAQMNAAELASFEAVARDRWNREFDAMRQELQREYDHWYQKHFRGMMRAEEMWKVKGNINE